MDLQNGHFRSGIKHLPRIGLDVSVIRFRSRALLAKARKEPQTIIASNVQLGRVQIGEMSAVTYPQVDDMEMAFLALDQGSAY